MPTVFLYKAATGIPNQIQISNSMHTGGEGTVYFSIDGQYAVKIYHDNRCKADKRRFLEQVMTLGSNLTPYEASFLCWPIGLVGQVGNDDCFGCVTRCLPTPPYRKLEDIMLTPKQAKEQFQTGKSWAHYLQVARGLARSVKVLHGKGCAHADLSSRNFLVDINEASAALIDLDGVVVEGFLPAQVSGSAGYMAPEVVKGNCQPNERSDDHSLAVLILHTLLFRNVLNPLVCYDDQDQAKDELLGWGEYACFSEHPQNSCNRPLNIGKPLFQRGQMSYKALTPTLQRLTELAFIDGLHTPNKRPSAHQWLNALSWAIDELWLCKRCHLHFPYPHWINPVNRRTCPFCGQRLSVPFPSVLRVYEPRATGSYTFTNRYLIVGNGWKLFADVLDSRREPPIRRQSEPIVGHVEWDKKNKLFQMVNDEGEIWHVRNAIDGSYQTVPKGKSYPLLVGATINFGKDRRLLEVIE